MNNFVKPYPKKKNRLINVTPEYCFDVLLVDFEQIIMITYNWKLNHLVPLIIFPWSQTNLE